jgi:hypothetical protein
VRLPAAVAIAISLLAPDPIIQAARAQHAKLAAPIQTNIDDVEAPAFAVGHFVVSGAKTARADDRHPTPHWQASVFVYDVVPVLRPVEAQHKTQVD